MANPQNLRPWRKGQSGNPAGYSRRRREDDALLEMVREPDVADAVTRIVDELGLVDALAAVCLARALGGDIRFFRVVLDAVDGPIER
jgi:hypothetical protein